MLGDLMVIIKSQLEAFLQSLSRANPEMAATESLVNFVTSDRDELVGFKSGSISLALFRLEQETVIRPPLPFTRSLADGTSGHVSPDIYLNFYLLAVARFKDYAEGLNQLSMVIQYFLEMRWFDADSYPAMPKDMEPFEVELVSLSVSEQNELWSMFRTAYLPSVAFRIKRLAFRDRAAEAQPPIGEIERLP